MKREIKVYTDATKTGLIIDEIITEDGIMKKKTFNNVYITWAELDKAIKELANPCQHIKTLGDEYKLVCLNKDCKKIIKIER